MNTYFLDENIDGPIAHALARTDIEFVRIQETHLREEDDPAIIEYTAEVGSVLVSHDQATLPTFFWQFIEEGNNHPGLIVIPASYRKQVSNIIDYLKAMRSSRLSNLVWWYPTLASQKEDKNGNAGN